MSTPASLTLLKVKRRSDDEALPDLLLLDRIVDPKRSRTDVTVRVYERVKEPVSSVDSVPLAKLKPSVADSLSALKVTEDGVSEDEASEAQAQYEFYQLKSGDLEEVDLTGLCRIYLPEQELLLENSGEEDESYSENDSNAENYYQNDYPDEEDDEQNEDEYDAEIDCADFKLDREDIENGDFDVEAYMRKMDQFLGEFYGKEDDYNTDDDDDDWTTDEDEDGHNYEGGGTFYNEDCPYSEEFPYFVDYRDENGLGFDCQFGSEFDFEEQFGHFYR